MTPYLAPIERPRALLLRLGYRFMRRQFGRVPTPMSVFSSRMPLSFSSFYGKLARLDKKLQLAPGTAALIRQQVSSSNGCAYCMDSNRANVLRRAAGDAQKFDALAQYRTSPLFSAAERAALDYASELATTKSMSAETFDGLARHYDEREICEIVYLVASEHIYNITNLGLNIGSDGYCELVRA